jgi:hypothetical protein
MAGQNAPYCSVQNLGRGSTISDLKGAVIETGEKARVQINIGDNTQLRLGSNGQFNLKDPCGGGGKGFSAKLMRGRIYAFISRLVGGDHVVINDGNCASGVRGEMRPYPGSERGKIFLASLAIPSPVLSRIMAEQEEYADMVPAEEEIEKAQVVFMAESASEGSFHIKVIKGVVKLKDSAGYVRILKTGQEFTKNTKPGFDPSDLKRIFIIVER